jgi:hypothetical protein
MARRRTRRVWIKRISSGKREEQWKREVRESIGPESLVHMLDVTWSMALGITDEQTDRFLVAGSKDRWLAELAERLDLARAKIDELRQLQRPRPADDAWLQRQLEGLGKEGA